MTTDLGISCEQVFSENGPLKKNIPSFIARSTQINMALAVAASIDKQSQIVVEAGTGTGKTFAYLVPCLLSGKKILISTATKNLQDQLFQKDIPILLSALKIAVSIQNLKGRTNYICQYRVNLHSLEDRFSAQAADCMNDIIYIRKALPRLVDGLLSELPEISEDSRALPYVTSTTENCLGTKCSYYQTCFLVKARKRAISSDVVVINHHLFFADSRLKEEGFFELLPLVDVVVFDEAHQLADIAMTFHDERFGTRKFRDLVDDILKEWPLLDLANQPLKTISLQADRVLDKLWLALPPFESKIGWGEIVFNKLFLKSFEDFHDLIDELIDCLEKAGIRAMFGKEHLGLTACFKRLENFKAMVLQFTKKDIINIRWLERFKHSLVFHLTPFDIGEDFSRILKQNTASYVFTSATLTMDSSFDCFTKPLGLISPQVLLLPSPFDYKKQALLYLPRGLPDSRGNTYYECFLEKILPIIRALGGRCFCLFTSHKALKWAASKMQSELDFPLLVQGTEAKSILLARFRTLGNAVLLGTSTFWEGVDVIGSALSCVIIDKLPFGNPYDPVVNGQLEYLKAAGISGFEALSLPKAVLNLKQGMGRLIRSTTDKGLFVIGDPRLTGRQYAKQIFASLPAMQKTRDLEKVLTFINEVCLGSRQN